MDDFGYIPQYVAIRLPRGMNLSPGGAGLLTAYVCRRRGRAGWSRAAVDSFSGKGGTLLLARPVEYHVVGVAGSALPFLYKYFTE